MTPLPKPTVLLAEDDDALRDLLALALAQAGWNVTCAADGAEALELARCQPPELILLDILLPKVNGLDVLRALKQQTEFERLPIIVMSELAFREIVQQAVAAGAQDFVVKPFDLQVLLEKAQKARLQPVRFVARPSAAAAHAPKIRPFRPPQYKRAIENLPTAG